MNRSFMLLMLPLLLAACGKSDVPGADPGMTPASDSAAAGGRAVPSAPADAPARKQAGSAGHKYDVESGMLQMKNSMAGGLHTIYFDDYGARQAIYMDMSFMGKKMQTVQVIADGWTYSYDQQSKTGRKASLDESGILQPPDPAELSEEKRRELKYQELEPRTILGYEAPGYAIEISQAPGAPSMMMRVWRWKRVPFRMEIQVPGGPPIVTEVTKAEFDVDVPAEKFQVPDDVKLSEEPASDGAPVMPGN